jgi:polyribonucleotide nucleotidyltransferase
VKIFKEVFELGNRQVTIETGGIARQATSAVTVTIGETVVLVTAVAQKTVKPGMDFFPLTINYQEKAYAAGKIPGGFPRREGRPANHETLTARLIDRPLRPLFPKGFHNEVQIVATVLSFDPEVPADMPALIGASASLALSGVPFDGPVGGVRVGFIDGKYIINPSHEEMLASELDLIVAGTKDAVLMVESEAECLPEEVMLGSVLYGHEQMQTIIEAIAQLKKHAGKPAWKWEAPLENKALKAEIKQKFQSEIAEAYSFTEKQKRNESLAALKIRILETMLSDTEDDIELDPSDISSIIASLEKEYVRKNILSGQARIDGRDTRTVRPISVKTGVLPRAHGSALFTRGETQALVVTTLGNDRDAQLLENIAGDSKSRFMLHYNFPPYCVGESGFMGTPKRREIGHANLANRALACALPSEEEYPYVIRVVSEITESNGSSSMATVCGSSLSMMDAGVSVKAPVAGIAMGLIKEGSRFAVLSDILGDEDHLGDMDFKVAGTEHGITALQMDIKIKGITRDIMAAALDQAKEGRIHILGIMNEELSTPRVELSPHAPQMRTIKVLPNKVRDIIGKGGATIKGLAQDTGASVDVSDDGSVKIFAKTRESLEMAISKIEAITADVENGKTYDGTVVKLMDFGVFINLMPGKDGLLHISQMGDGIDSPEGVYSEGDKVSVTVVNVDRQGKIKLSLAAS